MIIQCVVKDVDMNYIEHPKNVLNVTTIINLMFMDYKLNVKRLGGQKWLKR